MSGHTKLFGSTSSRTLGCPAHLQRGAHVPDPASSDAALEGTMLHEFCEHVLLMGPGVDYTVEPVWEELNDDQRNIVNTYVGLVREIAEGAEKFKVELRTVSEHLHPEWFGTADAVGYKPPRLTIADLKCGRVPVSVFEYGTEDQPSPQLGSYAISVLENMKPTERALVQEVELIIVQPREGGIKRAVFTRRQLDKLKERLLSAAKLAESANPPAAVGPWCHFCKVKPVCPTQRDFVMEQAKLDFALEGGAPTDLLPVELHSVLAHAKTAIEWGQSVLNYGEQRLQEGDPLDGNWQLVPKRAKREWTDRKVVERLLLNAGLELEEILDEVLKSPAQIGALLKQKGIQVDLADMVESVSTGLKIAKIEKGENNGDGSNDGWD